jgi:hypothetical protein
MPAQTRADTDTDTDTLIGFDTWLRSRITGSDRRGVL